MRSGFALSIGAMAFLLLAGPASAGETITYSFDAQGRLVSASSAGTVNNNRKHAICYDAAGNRIKYKSDPGGAGITCPAPTPATVTMPLPSIRINDPSAFEGQPLIFIIELSNPYTSTVSVNYATATGTAAANDFTAKSGTVTFTAGQMVQSVSVSTAADSRVEFDETMTLNLSGATGGAVIADSQGIGTILDNNGGGTN